MKHAFHPSLQSLQRQDLNLDLPDPVTPVSNTSDGIPFLTRESVRWFSNASWWCGLRVTAQLLRFGWRDVYPQETTERLNLSGKGMRNFLGMAKEEF